MIKSNMNEDIKFDIGKIDQKDIKEILESGYMPRKQVDEQRLNELVIDRTVEEVR